MTARKFYRVEGRRDYDDQCLLDLRTMSVVRETPKGVWVELWEGAPRKGGQKFILNDSRKKYAYDNITDARASFIIRRQRHIQHLKNTLQTAIECLALCEEGAEFGAKNGMIELFSGPFYA